MAITPANPASDPEGAAGAPFEFAFARSYVAAARLFGIRPDTAQVSVTDGTLRARFGPWLLTTPLANVAAAAVTGPYRWIKTAGPARLAVTDRGLTFATNPRHGVEIRFHQPVAGIEPTGRLRHPTLTVTVADYGTLAAVLNHLPGTAP